MQPAASRRPPSPEDVDRIAGMTDPVLRNCAITLGYHDLGVAFAQRQPEFTNWLMFAVWASKQAGQTIRGEDLPANLRRYLHSPLRILKPVDSIWRWLLRKGLLSPETRLGRFVRAVPGPLDSIEAASGAIADGNKLIFGEIARLFAVYAATGGPGPGPDELLSAFKHFEQAMVEPDAAKQAQLRYMANMEIAWYEQKRAQPLVVKALNGPVIKAKELGDAVLLAIAPPFLRVTVLAWIAGAMVMPFAQAGLALARMIITDALMTLTVPKDRVLLLGFDIETACPDCLAEITLPELKALLANFDGENVKCGAEDWSRLEDRMRYIARFFRVYHSDSLLGSEPFTAAQRAVIESGKLPFGAI